MHVSYVIISPVRDEEKYLHQTLCSVAAQTMPPRQWVIIDDGSSDATGRIIDEWAARHTWITPVHRANRGFRRAGGGVIEAFYEGYRRLGGDIGEFIVKLDGDLSFPPDYFQRCFEHFAADATLGIGGGGILNEINGRLVPENVPRFHVRGATKIYRRACWEAIGGLVEASGWDTLDEVYAAMKGWTTESFPDLALIHHRPTGGAEGPWANGRKNGTGSYLCGYSPAYLFARSLRMAASGRILEAAGVMAGFCGAWLAGSKRINDKNLIAYLRRQQINRLLGRPTIWH